MIRYRSLWANLLHDARESSVVRWIINDSIPVLVTRDDQPINRCRSLIDQCLLRMTYTAGSSINGCTTADHTRRTLFSVMSAVPVTTLWTLRPHTDRDRQRQTRLIAWYWSIDRFTARTDRPLAAAVTSLVTSSWRHDAERRWRQPRRSEQQQIVNVMDDEV